MHMDSYYSFWTCACSEYRGKKVLFFISVTFMKHRLSVKSLFLMVFIQCFSVSPATITTCPTGTFIQVLLYAVIFLFFLNSYCSIICFFPFLGILIIKSHILLMSSIACRGLLPKWASYAIKMVAEFLSIKLIQWCYKDCFFLLW